MIIIPAFQVLTIFRIQMLSAAISPRSQSPSRTLSYASSDPCFILPVASSVSLSFSITETAFTYVSAADTVLLVPLFRPASITISLSDSPAIILFLTGNV